MEENEMTGHYNMIVIGGSAGSLQVILRLFKHIKPRFHIPFIIVLHRNTDSALEEVLGFKTKLPVKEIEEKEIPKPGNIYVCPADYHVLIEKDHSFSLDYSEKVNFSRPSIDVVFRAAADVYGKGLICILLSGASADGAEGMAYAKKKGACAVVQNPDDAAVAYMPQQALQLVNADYTLAAKDIGPFINSLR